MQRQKKGQQKHTEVKKNKSKRQGKTCVACMVKLNIKLWELIVNHEEQPRVRTILCTALNIGLMEPDIGSYTQHIVLYYAI